MKYYIITFEQVHTEKGLGEYATKSDAYDTMKSATSKYLEKSKNVNDDLSDAGHTFMEIKLMNSIGGVEKHDKYGEYVDENTEE